MMLGRFFADIVEGVPWANVTRLALKQAFFRKSRRFILFIVLDASLCVVFNSKISSFTIRYEGGGDKACFLGLMRIFAKP